MRKVFAFMRVSWLTAASYRLGTILSIGGLVVGFIPLYFIAGALQPVVADSIRMEGEEYFGFLVIGIAVTAYLGFAMRSLPGAIAGGIRSGTLESLLATPTSLPTLLAGQMAYPFLLTTLRSLLLLVGISVVGTPVTWVNLPLAAATIGLIVLAHLPVGLVAAALFLLFRTSGPLVSGALAASILLGGVYYSTTVIPEFLRPLTAFIPLTYGLRALRQALLSGASFSSVAPDLALLSLITLGLLLFGLLAFRLALAHARRTGSLAQY